MTSHSPMWMPARTCNPTPRIDSQIALAHWIPRVGPVECCHESVTGLLDVSAIEVCESGAHDVVVPLKLQTPHGVPGPGGLPSRVDDVGEHDRRQDPVGCRSSLAFGLEGASVVLHVHGARARKSGSSRCRNIEALKTLPQSATDIT